MFTNVLIIMNKEVILKISSNMCFSLAGACLVVSVFGIINKCFSLSFFSTILMITFLILAQKNRMKEDFWLLTKFENFLKRKKK